MKLRSEKEVLKTIGLNIVQLRNKKGLSQSDLCYEIDMDISTLSRLERGLLNPTFGSLYKIASYFQIDISALIS